MKPESTYRRGAGLRGRRGRRAVIAVLAGSLALAGCFGNGLHRVASPLTSTQMPPGLWRSLGGSPCSWSRIGNPSITGRSTHTAGPQYAQIAASDVGFAANNCLPFWQQPGPFAKPLVQPGSPFGEGDFLVNFEVAPGTYTASFPPGQRCSWAVVRGFRGNDAAGRNPDAVRSDSNTTGVASVLITPFDYGFTSQGCGRWSPAQLAAAPGGASTSPVTTDGDVEDFPDPFVLRIDDVAECGGDPVPCYFAYGTETGFLGLINVPVVRSTDLSTWTWAGPVNAALSAQAEAPPGKDAMPELAPWVDWGANWAPSVLFRPDNPPESRYVMYYTAKSLAGSSGAGKQCVGVATSAVPDGPFTDSSSRPLVCQPSAGGTIDPGHFVAADGSLSLQYADDIGIHAQRLSADGLSLAGGEQLLLRFDGGYTWELPRVEGPSMMQSPNGILLFYSAQDFATPNYAVGVARCDTPLGPCRRVYSTAVLPKRGSMLGPGGQAPLQRGDGTWQLAFHAWDGVVGYSNHGKRSMHFLPLTFPGGNPKVG